MSNPDQETRYAIPEVKSFYEYQHPTEAYEVKGIRPKTPRIFKDQE